MNIPLSLGSRTTAAILLLPGLAIAQQAAAPRIAVVPFAALSGDVPPRAGAKAAGLLSAELKNVDGLVLVESRDASQPDPLREALAEARRGVEEAKEFRGRRQFRAAEASLARALERYAQAAPALTEVDELQDAYVLLAALRYATGRDEEGEQTLALALSLAPNREPPLARTSPLFARTVAASRKKVLESAKGSLRVESTPPGAGTLVDGVAIGATPIHLKDVPPGLHLWRVLLPSGEAAGGVAQIAPGQSSRVSAQARGSDPESKLLAALARNRIDQPLLEAAAAHAKALQADLLIFGALSREGRSLALDSFVLKTASGEVRRLPRSTFDAELLSAGMAFYDLAGRLAKEGLRSGSDARVPGPVSAELKTGAAPVAEVRYGEDPSHRALDADGGGAIVPVAGTGERAAPEQKKRSPLKRPRQ